MITASRTLDTLNAAAYPLTVAPHADTTALQLCTPAVDSMGVADAVCVADSEPVVADVERIHYREVTPAELFGRRSEQASMPPAPPAPAEPTFSGGFSALVLLLVGLYVQLIYRHPADVSKLLRHLTHDRGSEERLYEDSAGSFTRFLNLCSLLGVGMVGAIVVRLCSAQIPAEHLALMPQTAAALWVVALIAALAVAILYRVLVATAVGVLTFTRPLFERLYLIKRMMLALFTVMATPVTALWLLARDRLAVVWLVVIFIELIVALVLYLYETRQLFLSKKISILHWILYLCGVEIFPLSLLWLLVGRFA